MWNEIKFIKFLKDKMPFTIKIFVIRVLVAFQYIKGMILPEKTILSVSKESNKNVIFILLGTDYANLGDHAMTYAHEKMLKNEFPQYELVEILVSDTMKYIKALKRVIKKGDIITLKGGGNVGLEYFREELYRRLILKIFKDNKIVLFPQTVYFPDTRLGKKEFKNTVKIFNQHNNFKLILRDEISYKVMKSVITKNEVILTPDIVLSLDNPIIGKERNYATILMRNDKEGIYGKKEKELVKDVLDQKYKNVRIADTCADYIISKHNRKEELDKMWELIGESKIVITDRLHGMIFAAITETPCIVLNTYNHKLRGVYKWVEHLNYIKVADLKTADLMSKIDELMILKVVPYDKEEYKHLFEKIISLIKK